MEGRLQKQFDKGYISSYEVDDDFMNSDNYYYNGYNYNVSNKKQQQQKPRQISAGGTALTRQFEQWHLSDGDRIKTKQQEITLKQTLKAQRKNKSKKQKVQKQQQQHLQLHMPLQYTLQQARPIAQQNDYGQLQF